MSFIAHVRKNGDTPQMLHEHLRNVGAMAGANAAKIRLGMQGELIGLLHDLGKYSQAFQNYLKSAVGLLNQDEDEDYVDAARLKGRIDHSTAGAQLIWFELSKQGGLGCLVGQVLSLCIASHHSGLIDCIAPDGEDTFGKRMSKRSDRTSLDEAVAAVFAPEET